MYYGLYVINQLYFVVTLDKTSHKLNDVGEEAQKTLY